jgi:glycine cleavage system H protein
VVAGLHALIARTGYTGEDGYEVFVDVEKTGVLWDAMLAAGAPDGLVPVGLGARDTLRLEAGMPLYGNELDLATNPFEASLGRVVKLGKAGPFTGRAALEKVARDGVERKLVGLILRERGIARHGYPVLVGGARAGVVTSGTQSPTLGQPIAMAYVPTASADPGTMVAVEIRGAPVAAEVVPGDLRYTSDHEWVRVEGDEVVVGITQFAADQLGDIVFVELPAVGRALKAHATFGVVESVKAVSDLFAPIGGNVLAANDALAASPELVNSDPYGTGWMLRLRPADAAEIDGLLDAAAYEQVVAEG